MALSATYDFEEGQDGRLIPLGNGITAINGNPIYQAQAAIKGKIGANSPLSGGTWTYNLPNSTGCGVSVYGRMRIPQPGDTTDLFILKTAGGGRVGSVRMKSAGKFDIADTFNNAVTTSGEEWTLYEPFKLDAKFNYTPGGSNQMHMESLLYLGGDLDNNPSGATDSTLIGTWDAFTAFSVIVFGDQSPGSSFDIDYIRFYDTYEFPADTGLIPSPDWNRVPVFWGPAEYISGEIPKGNIKFKPNVYR